MVAVGFENRVGGVYILPLFIIKNLMLFLY